MFIIILEQNEKLFLDWYYINYDSYYFEDFNNLSLCPHSILCKFESYLCNLKTMADNVFSFELRGDDLSMLMDLIEIVPSDRKDILSWLCYVKSELNEFIVNKTN